MAYKKAPVVYSDWQSFLTDCAQPAPDAWGEVYSVKGDAAWTKTRDYAHAMRLASDGWPEGRSQMVAGVSSAPTSARHATHWLDVAGAYPMVPAAVAGDPACMVACGEESDPRGIVRLVVGGFYSAGNSKKSITNRGVALCAVIDAVEATGRRVEVVWAVWGKAIRTGGEPYRINVTVKDASEPLDLDRLAFALAHPSAFRRLMFRQVERHYSKEDHGTSYGMPMPVKDDQPGAIVIQPMHLDVESNFNTVEAATAHVAAAFKAGGVEVEFQT